MSRIIGCILLAAALLLTSACADEAGTELTADSVRTATPMETLTADEALRMEEEEAAAAADATVPAQSFEELYAAEQSPEDFDAWGAEESAAPEPEVTAGRTATPMQTAEPAKTEAPEKTAAVQDTEASASAEKTANPTSTLEPLAQYVILPGDMQFAVSPDWPSPAKPIDSEQGMRVYEVQPSDKIIIMYQNVGSALTGNHTEDKDILLKMVEAQGLWFGARELSDVSDIAGVPYAWVSWFGHSNDLIDADPDLTHMAAFSDGKYLYIAAQISSVEIESSMNEWTAFLDSMTLNGDPVWFEN